MKPPAPPPADPRPAGSPILDYDARLPRASRLPAVRGAVRGIVRAAVGFAFFAGVLFGGAVGLFDALTRGHAAVVPVYVVILLVGLFGAFDNVREMLDHFRG